jgi:hypothetical protein
MTPTEVMFGSIRLVHATVKRSSGERIAVIAVPFDFRKEQLKT